MSKTFTMRYQPNHRKNKFRLGSIAGKLVTFCLLLFYGTSFSQSSATIKGLVENQVGEPLQGVTVLLKSGENTKDQTKITDVNGIFLFTGLPADLPLTLTISYVGYESQIIRRTLSAGKEEAMLISLVTNAGSMQSVVVVGYGSQKRKDVTGAVSSVPQDRLDKVPNLNIGQVLQGSISGMMVQQTTAGAASSEELMVRGRKSILANNSPLIVVDGIPYGGQLRDINVNDVQSIDVLKDASAAAIYGSRGANGVILITTKIGVKGKPIISYDGRIATQKAINVPFFMTGDEFYEFKNIREPGKITASEQDVYDAGKTENWADRVLQTGMSQQHALSVSGGFQQTRYFIAGSFLDVKGVTLNDKYRRFTNRINLDSKVTSWLTVGTRTQLSFDDRSGVNPDWEDVLRANPLTRAYNDAGEFNLYPWPEHRDIGNPLEPARYTNNDKSYQLITNNYAQIDAPFLKGLSYRINVGVRKTTVDIGTYIGQNTRTGLEARGVANTQRTLQDNLVVENLLSYEHVFNKKHHLSFTGLYSYEKNTASSNIVDARGFPNDFLSWYSMAQANQVVPLYLYNRTDLISQMARVNYTFMSRYLLTITGRRDGYSGFGANNKWGTFPSVAIGWNISDEKFFPFTRVIDRLKIRASLGRNGNQAVTAYETISRLAERNMVSLDQALPGYIPSKLGQDNLGWESTTTFNLGIDFSLFKGRITGDLNLYKIRTKDLLLNRTISLVHGIGSITQNIGETENKGLELSLTTSNIETKDFQWSTTANVSIIKNKIVSLYGMKDANGKEIDDIANKWFIGQPILVNHGYVFNGVWQTSEAADATTWGTQPGFVKLKDVNNDKQITADDREVMGQLDPKWMWGMNNSFSYKGFNLQVFIHGVHGITRENRLLQDASSSSEVRRSVLKKNWWTPENPTNEFYANAVNAERMSGISAVIFEDASFIRIKDISLSYDFSGNVLSKTGLGRMRIYATARNLVTITKWTASDPELNFGRGALPLQRELVLGVNITL